MKNNKDFSLLLTTEQTAAMHKAQYTLSKCTTTTVRPHMNDGFPIGYDEYQNEDNNAVVPITKNDEVFSLQFISPNGEISYLENGYTEGCYYKFGVPEWSEALIVCADYATGEEFYQITGCAVFCALEESNIEHVVIEVSEKYKDNPVFIISNKYDIFALYIMCELCDSSKIPAFLSALLAHTTEMMSAGMLNTICEKDNTSVFMEVIRANK